MRHLGIAALAAAVIAAGAARAAPIDDVGPWIAKFQAAVAADRFDEMAADVRAIAAPSFPSASTERTFGDLAKLVDRNPVDLTGPIDERHLGSFLKRVTIAAHYKRGYIFYAVTFTHDPSGWQLLAFSYDVDVNEILSLEWPS